MTQTEKDKLKQELSIIYPEVDTILLDKIVEVNQDLPYQQAKIHSQLLIIQRLILEIDEKIKLGELEAENKQKLQILQQKEQQLKEATKKKHIGVIYLEQDG